MSVRFTSNSAEVQAHIKASIRRALSICGSIAEGYAKGSCPVKEGRLRGSITHEPVSDDTEFIGTDVEYAPFVELGHNQQPGRYVPAIGKRLVASHVAAKPFLAPAVENHVAEYQNIIQQELKV